jgi:hypothetical protein
VVTRDCKLRIPRLHTLRIEKEPTECPLTKSKAKENASLEPILQRLPKINPL